MLATLLQKCKKSPKCLFGYFHKVHRYDSNYFRGFKISLWANSHPNIIAKSLLLFSQLLPFWPIFKTFCPKGFWISKFRQQLLAKIWGNVFHALKSYRLKYGGICMLRTWKILLRRSLLRRGPFEITYIHFCFLQSSPPPTHSHHN